MRIEIGETKDRAILQPEEAEGIGILWLIKGINGNRKS